MKSAIAMLVVVMGCGCAHPKGTFIRFLPAPDRWKMLNASLDSCLAMSWQGSVTFDNGHSREVMKCDDLKKMILESKAKP